MPFQGNAVNEPATNFCAHNKKYLEFGPNEISPEFTEKIRRVSIEITRSHGHQVVGRCVVGALLGTHEETIPHLKKRKINAKRHRRRSRQEEARRGYLFIYD